MAHHDHARTHSGLDEADWSTMVDRAEREGERFVAVVRQATAWAKDARSVAPGTHPVRRVLDVGSGPGVGTCELAVLFPEAIVVAVDASHAMLTRAAARAARHGLAARVTTYRAELPDGIEGTDAVAALGRADVVWASLSLHHVRDQPRALRALHTLVDPQGVVAIVELDDPDHDRPDDTADPTPITDLPAMLAAAGFDVARSTSVRHGEPDAVDDDGVPSVVDRRIVIARPHP
jgi:trans-aconitate methyltransferase